MGYGHTVSALVAVSAFFITTCSLLINASAQNQATTICAVYGVDNARQGECIPVLNCSFFLKMVTEPVSQHHRIILRQNRCNRHPVVHICCPLEEASSGSTERPTNTQALAPSRHPLLPTTCGVVKWERSRVGLKPNETVIDEYPWQALIEFTTENNTKIHACGGVLISDRYVLSSAHCAAGGINNWKVSAVRLGEWDTLMNPDCIVIPTKTDCAPGIQDLEIEEITAHPLFNKQLSSPRSDIALIRLKNAAVLSGYVQPICLPNKQLTSAELVGLSMEVAGWQLSSTSRMGKSEVVGNSLETCKATYAPLNILIDTSQICGDIKSTGCAGNTGGPLMLNKDNTYLLAGVQSFEPLPCPNPAWPNVYTRVAHYIDWIHANLKP